MSKFRLGDRVLIGNGNSEWLDNRDCGKLATIMEDGSVQPYVRVDGCRCGCLEGHECHWIPEEDMELIHPGGAAPRGPETNQPKQEKTAMSAALELRNAKLTDNQRFAYGQGLTNSEHTLTSEGVAALNRYLYDKYEDELLDAIRAAKKKNATDRVSDTMEVSADIPEDK